MKIRNKTSEPHFINKNMIKCQQKSFKIQGKITKIEPSGDRTRALWDKNFRDRRLNHSAIGPQSNRSNVGSHI